MDEILSYIKSEANLEKQKAILTLTLLYQKSVGIGDHSTSDYYKNIDEAFSMFCSAEEKLSNLKKLKDLLKEK